MLEDKKIREEIQWCRTGEILAMIANVNRDSKKRPIPYSRRDFIRVSWDKAETTEDQKMTPEEVDAKYSKFLKQTSDGSVQ